MCERGRRSVGESVVGGGGQAQWPPSSWAPVQAIPCRNKHTDSGTTESFVSNKHTDSVSEKGFQTEKRLVVVVAAKFFRQIICGEGEGVAGGWGGEREAAWKHVASKFVQPIR